MSPRTLQQAASLVTQLTGAGTARFALALDTPATAGKVVLHATRATGEPLAELQFAITGQARDRMFHAAASIAQLCRFQPLRRHLPEVLFAGRCGREQAVFLSPADGDAGPAHYTGLHARFLETLRHASAVQRSGARLVEEVGASWQRSARILDVRWHELGRDALRRATQALRGADIACGVFHGNFVPANTRVREGLLFVTGWEYAEWDMPACWDMFHFDLEVSSRLGRDSGIRMERLEAPVWDGLYLLYLLHSVSRLLERGADADAIGCRKQKLAALLAEQPEHAVLQWRPRDARQGRGAVQCGSR